MTDDKSQVVFDHEAFEISYEDMLRFMNAHFTQTACPQCGEDKGWSIDTGNGPEPTHDKLTIYKMEYANGDMFRPFVSSACNYCGSLRQMAAKRVVAWIAENPEASE
ncbi:hypothetical protein K3369_06625 [Pseudomonas mandelii]|uniref:hypothetical protein n=1 Tax=Pseudomonas mandelii TaxID=75612 RepID=UPI001C834BD3|nr:hypothetical protein [Pseudomonas mandelii]QZA99270.1 hypothetical protein K3369_06625 [Pseudomonas mandelii]